MHFHFHDLGGGLHPASHPRKTVDDIKNQRLWGAFNLLILWICSVLVGLSSRDLTIMRFFDVHVCILVLLGLSSQI